MLSSFPCMNLCRKQLCHIEAYIMGVQAPKCYFPTHFVLEDIQVLVNPIFKTTSSLPLVHPRVNLTLEADGMFAEQ